MHVGDEIPKQEAQRAQRSAKGDVHLHKQVLDFFKPVSQDLGKVKAPENLCLSGFCAHKQSQAPKSVPLVSNESFRKECTKATFFHSVLL